MTTIATHNGRFTVKNPKTGEHRTFRVRTQSKDAQFAPNERVVSMLIGSCNETAYKGFGFVKDGGKIAVWKKCRGGQYDKLARMLERLPEFEAAGMVEVHAETRCRKCNRALTTPESVTSGIGPVCGGRTGETDSGDADDTFGDDE